MAAKEGTATQKTAEAPTPRPEPKSSSPGDGAPERVAAGGADAGMAAARATAQTASAAAQRWPTDPFQFMTRRLDRQIQHMGALMSCRSPGEILELETRFTMESMQDYLDETNRVFQNAAQIGSDLLSDWQESARRQA